MPNVKVNKILGREQDLFAAVESAFLRRQFTPEQIATAAKVRYIGRVRRMLQAYQNPEERVLCWNKHAAAWTYPTPAVALAQLEAGWAEYWEAYRGVRYSAEVVQALHHMSYAVGPATGVCVAGNHMFMPNILRGLVQQPHRLHITNEHERPWQTYINEQSMYPSEYPALPAVICPNHQTIACPMCFNHSTATALELPVLMTWLKAGCAACQSREWLCQKKPSKCNALQIKTWMVAVQQFAAAL